MHRTVSLLLGIVVAGGIVPAVAQENDDRLTLDLYLDWERVSNPQVSPDGGQIVYTRQLVDKVNDRWQSSLWIMNADGSRNRHLTEGSSPSWSPDGTRILFTRKGEPRGTQIFVRWMDAEGAETQITTLDKTPSNVRWAPNGEQIDFSMTVPGEQQWRVSLPSRPSCAKWTEYRNVVTRLN